MHHGLNDSHTHTQKTPDYLQWHRVEGQWYQPRESTFSSLQPCTVICRRFSGSQFPAVKKQIFWAEFMASPISQYVSSPEHLALVCATCATSSRPTRTRIHLKPPPGIFQVLSLCLTGFFGSQAPEFVSRYMLLVECLEETGLPSVCVYLWQLNGE